MESTDTGPRGDVLRVAFERLAKVGFGAPVVIDAGLGKAGLRIADHPR